MARDEKRGKRDRRDDKWDGKRVGPEDDDEPASESDLAKFRPSREEIDRMLDEE